MIDNNIIACLCEGSAEEAIMEILLDNNAVIFRREEMLEGKPLRVRSAVNFEEKYLRKSFKSKITVYRILDSRNEKFKLGKFYKDKVAVVNVITAPEIEMLVIHNEDKYDDFKRSKRTPSEYCTEVLKLNKVKTYDFMKSYFSNVRDLVSAIKKYKQKSSIKRGEITLDDLLK